MLHSGMFGNSKSEMYSLLHSSVVPKFMKVNSTDSLEFTRIQMKENGLTFPVFVKPEIGERGFQIKRIENASELSQYHHTLKSDYLIQQQITLPLEISLFVYKLPGSSDYTISSIVSKELLCVVGDGHNSLGKLIENYPRASIQVKRLFQRWRSEWNTIIPNGVKFVLTDVANHSKGAKFHNLTELLSPAWTRRVQELIIDKAGFHFGRFDIRCESLQDFPEGKPISVLELNGIGAEPIDMYIEGLPLYKGLQILWKHWTIQCKIAEKHLVNGAQVPDAQTGFKRFFAYKKQVKHFCI